jgi:hypothetical protein
MNYEKQLYLLETVRSLKKSGSWTGKTHVVKTLAMVDLVRKLRSISSFTSTVHIRSMSMRS